MLITAIRRKMALDAAVLLELIDARLEEMLVALQAWAVEQSSVRRTYVSRVERKVQRLVSVLEKYRTICAP